MTREIRLDQNNDGLISDDEASFYLSGHESYNKVNNKSNSISKLGLRAVYLWRATFNKS